MRSTADRIARAIVARYPRVWRERYGDEMLALLDDAPAAWPQVADLGRTAVGEWMREVTGEPDSKSGVRRRQVARFVGFLALSVATAKAGWLIGDRLDATGMTVGTEARNLTLWLGGALGLRVLAYLFSVAVADALARDPRELSTRHERVLRYFSVSRLELACWSLVLLAGSTLERLDDLAFERRLWASSLLRNTFWDHLATTVPLAMIMQCTRAALRDTMRLRDLGRVRRPVSSDGRLLP